MLKLEIFNPQEKRFIPNVSQITNSVNKNGTIPKIDLVVRESIQNSLDAALNGDKVNVEFTVGDFDKNNFFNIIDAKNCRLDNLRNKFQNLQNVYFLSIKDKYTTGLTGEPVDVNGNFYKLVYGFLDGKNSQTPQSGGSHGAGKTCFFKLGVGFVIYYSKIQNESRLIISYLKNSDEDIFQNFPLGIAWWGEENNTNEFSYPVTDINIIEKILSKFSLRPYDEDETGTQIIIPFLNKNLVQQFVDEENLFGATDDFADNMLKEIQEACVKWYAPRFRGFNIDDEYQYKYGPYLSCRFTKINQGNESTIQLYDSNVVKFSSLIRDLYASIFSDNNNEDIKVEKIVFQKNRTELKFPQREQPIGFFSFRKIPCEFDDLDIAKSNLVVYCRKPGMIINYDDRDWTKEIFGKLSKQSVNGEKYIGIFVVNSEAIYIKNDENRLLEEVFRAHEAEDHYQWSYNAALEITNNRHFIKSVVNRIGKIIEDKYGSQNDTVTGYDNVLGSYVAQKLFSNLIGGSGSFGSNSGKKVKNPEGNDPDQTVSDSGKSSKPKRNKNKPNVVFYAPIYKDDGFIEIPFSIVTCKKQEILLCLNIKENQGGSSVSKEKWEKDNPNISFPIEEVKASINNVSSQENIYVDGDKCVVVYNPSIDDINEIKGVMSYKLQRNDVVCVIKTIIKEDK